MAGCQPQVAVIVLRIASISRGRTCAFTGEKPWAEERLSPPSRVPTHSVWFTSSNREVMACPDSPAVEARNSSFRSNPEISIPSLKHPVNAILRKAVLSGPGLLPPSHGNWYIGEVAGPLRVSRGSDRRQGQHERERERAEATKIHAAMSWGYRRIFAYSLISLTSLLHVSAPVQHHRRREMNAIVS